jgi:glucan 1,4-alpha-glucosidase
MKKLNVLVMGLLLPMLAAAQTVKSPNGNVSVTFSLTEKGQPTYEMSYKGKTVCKPSHLGLELAKDKHASKGMEETSLMDGFTETGSKTSTFDVMNAHQVETETIDMIFVYPVFHALQHKLAHERLL